MRRYWEVGVVKELGYLEVQSSIVDWWIRGRTSETGRRLVRGKEERADFASLSTMSFPCIPE